MVKKEGFDVESNEDDSDWGNGIEDDEEEEEDDDKEEEEETTATTTNVNSLCYNPEEEGMDFEIEESEILQMEQDLEELKNMSFKEPFDKEFIAKSERIL